MLLITALLVGVVAAHGLRSFWPQPVAQIVMADGRSVLGKPIRSAKNPDTGEITVQVQTANRELDPQRMDFHWFAESALQEVQYPPGVFVLERVGNGDFYGFLEAVHTPTITLPQSADLRSRFEAALVAVRAQKAEQLEPLARRLASFNDQLQRLRNRILREEYRLRHLAGEASLSESASVADARGRLAELRAEEQRLKDLSDQVVADQLAREAELRKNTASFRVGSGEVYPIVLLDIVRAYQPNRMSFGAKCWHYLSKIGELVTDEPRESNTEGGLFPAIFGTVMLVFLMSVFCFPLGVLAGIYLGEYAREGFLLRLVRIAVNNLAGIPSIVYGVFGLGFFVYGLGATVDRWFFPERVEAGIPTYGTGGILWASLTLGLLTVPVVIVATEEALRTIPRGFREASYALGATKLQTLLRVLVPMASPGMMTGFILAMARAAGEVAPLMLTGVVKLAPTLPVDGHFPFFHLDRKFMHLGFHIFDIGFQSPNVEASKPMVYVTTLLLVVIVLAMSSTAIYLRSRMRKRYQWRTV